VDAEQAVIQFNKRFQLHCKIAGFRNDNELSGCFFDFNVMCIIERSEGRFAETHHPSESGSFLSSRLGSFNVLGSIFFQQPLNLPKGFGTI
jgi:hypothetical protein